MILNYETWTEGMDEKAAAAQRAKVALGLGTTIDRKPGGIQFRLPAALHTDSEAAHINAASGAGGDDQNGETALSGGDVAAPPNAIPKAGEKTHEAQLASLGLRLQRS